MKKYLSAGGSYYSGYSHIFFMKPFTRHSLAIKLWRRSTFNVRLSFSGTRIGAPDKHNMLFFEWKRYPKNVFEFL